MGPRQWSLGSRQKPCPVHPCQASMGPRQWSLGRGPAPRAVGSNGLRTGFARGSTRGGAKTVASSGDEVIKSKGCGLWAQREVSARRFRSNILIAKELWPGCGLINISAPHRSRVKGHEKPHQPARLARCMERGARGDLRVATAYTMPTARRKSPKPKWHEWPLAMGPDTGAGVALANSEDKACEGLALRYSSWTWWM